MSSTSGRTRPNLKLLSLGGAFLMPPGWVVFNGMRGLSGMPTALALLTVGSLAVTAIALVFLALQNLETGDVRDAGWQLGSAGVILAAEFLGQWWFAVTEDHALVTALVMSMLSCGGALIIEGEIMRVWKANGRASGQVSLARARVPREVARTFPVVGRIATRLAIRYPTATQRSVLDMAFLEWEQTPKTEPKPPAQVRVDVRELVTRPDAPAQLEAPTGQRPDTSGHQNGASGHPEDDVRALVPASGQLSDYVRTAIADGFTKDEAVTLATSKWAGVKPDSVRRAYDRASSPA